MDERVKPGASKKLKMVMIDKGIKIKDLAEAYQSRPSMEKSGEMKERKTSPNVVYNMFSRDNMTYATVQEMAELLGCEVVIRDKETGKIY